MNDSSIPITVMDVEDCWVLLTDHEYGRLALSVGNQPEIFPINYKVQSGTILFRTAPGTKLATLTVNQAVALEIDGYRDTGGWSVVLKGSAEAVEHGADLNAAQFSGLQPWVGTDKPIFVRIRPTEVTGRRVLFGPEPELD